jgi:energy-coupling factor transport system substrate-specific component
MSWVAASMLILGAALAVGFAWYERTHPSTRVIALVATLAALAAIGRIAFAALPNVKPTTDIVFISGFVLGGAPGFAVGSVAALASNIFFGQGPWTPWQMVGWGGVGVLGALLGHLTHRRLGRVNLALACAVSAAAFGAWMNIHLWVTYSGDHTLATLGAYFATSLWFDVAHVGGSIVFCLAFGPALVQALARYRTRFEVRWLAAPAAAATALLAVVIASAAPAPARAADAEADAAAARASTKYLIDNQNDDGGWGAAPGQSSSQLYSGWTALGLAAAGRNPRDVGSPSALAYIRAHANELNDLGELNRTLLILKASGRGTRIGGRDLEAAVASQQRRNGSFAGRVNTTAFAVLGLRAAGRPKRDRAIRRAVAWMAKEANDDGGYNFAGRGGPSGIDDTGAALQALGAAGRGRSPVAKRAVRFITRNQASDGGFALIPGGPSNAQSTAWAVQGLLAAGRNPAKVHRNGSRDPMSYLRSLTAPSGEVRYSRTSRQTPVWVTAQAVAALSRKTLPLARVPRERRAAAVTSAPAATPTATPAATATPAEKVKVQSLPPVGTPAPNAPPSALAAAARVPAVAALVAALM